MTLSCVCNPKSCLQYACNSACDIIDFICDLKLFKAINRNYFEVSKQVAYFLKKAYSK